MAQVGKKISMLRLTLPPPPPPPSKKTKKTKTLYSEKRVHFTGPFQLTPVGPKWQILKLQNQKFQKASLFFMVILNLRNTLPAYRTI